jgi:hypothetical protein
LPPFCCLFLRHRLSFDLDHPTPHFCGDFFDIFTCIILLLKEFVDFTHMYPSFLLDPPIFHSRPAAGPTAPPWADPRSVGWESDCGASWRCTTCHRWISGRLWFIYGSMVDLWLDIYGYFWFVNVNQHEKTFRDSNDSPLRLEILVMICSAKKWQVMWFLANGMM